MPTPITVSEPLRFHYDNKYENDNKISLSFSLRFCKRDERLVAFISSSTTMKNEYEPWRNIKNDDASTQKFVLVLVVVVAVKS